MDYFLNMGAFGSIFAVPKAVVDNYIKLANEAGIKVLLYMLRYNESGHSKNDIAQALNISEEQVEEAFIFWENANIFSKRDLSARIPVQNAQPVPASPVQQTSAVQETKTVHQIKKPVKPDPRNFSISPTEIAERINGSDEIGYLFMALEQQFGRPLTPMEQRSFIIIHDYNGLSAEVILMLTAYCFSIDKTSMSYITSVANDWTAREVDTLEKAEDEIKRLEESTSFVGKIMKMFSMDRKPTPKQQEFIDTWKENKYSFELIEYAYEKTLEKKGRFTFNYINGILESWHSKGISTRQQADEENNRFGEEQKLTHSFNLDEYKMLANDFGGKK